MTIADFLSYLLGKTGQISDTVERPVTNKQMSFSHGIADDRCVLLNRAHNLGLIDKYTLEHVDATVTRRDAARILHIFLRDVLSVPDLKDISAAGVLRDLYDCRVCVNDIAQVFCGGIMSAHDYPNGMLLFEAYEELTDAEAEDIFEKMKPFIADRGVTL